MTAIAPLHRPSSPAPETVPSGGFVLRLARWSTRHRLKAVIGWFVFVAVVFVAGGAAGTRLLTSAEQGTGESGTADRVVEQAGFPATPTERVLIRPAGAGRLDPAAARGCGRPAAHPAGRAAAGRDGR